MKPTFLAISALAISLSGYANATEFVQNGNFEATDVGSTYLSTNPALLYSFAGSSASPVTGWDFPNLPSAAIYNNMVVGAGNGDSPYWSSRGLGVFGPQNGYANGLTASSPAGGNYLMLDGDYDHAYAEPSLSQVINGLTIGQVYDLSFWFASAEGAGGASSVTPGPTTESLKVTFGNQAVTTETRYTPAYGFTAWAQEEFQFTATSTSQVLAFFAQGGPVGAPPESLLDGVSLTNAPVTAPVPEPATWGLMAGGLGFVGFFSRHRNKR